MNPERVARIKKIWAESRHALYVTLWAKGQARVHDRTNDERKRATMKAIYGETGTDIPDLRTLLLELRTGTADGKTVESVVCEGVIVEGPTRV